MNIIAIIQARGGSKTIPKKNIYLINGHPLISYTISAALNSKLINKLIVSTDDVEIKKVALDYGAEVPFIRPEKLSKDNTYSVDSLRYAVKECEKFYNQKFDIVIELPCVSPFRTNKNIDEVLEVLIKNKKLDSVTSYVSTAGKHPIRLKRIKNTTKIQSFCKDYIEPARGSRKQNFETCYIRNGAIYAMTRDCILKQKSRHGKNQYAYIMDENSSVNIDYPYDLLVAKLLIENGYCSNIPLKKNKYSISKNSSSKKPKVLVTAPFEFLEDTKKRLKKLFQCDFYYGASKKEILSLKKDYNGWLCAPSPGYIIDKTFLNKFKNLKIIATPSTGINHIDITECYKKGVKVHSLKGTNFVKKIKASSEFTLTLILAIVRKLNLAIKYPLQGKWREEENNLRSIELSKKVVGIIGFGRIGNNVAKYLNSMGMKIIFYDPYVKNSRIKFKKTNLKTLLKNSDIIILSAYLTKQNFNMCNKNFFNTMVRKPYFINTSRGELVNELALVNALKKKKISGAAVDVIKDEQTKNIKNNILVKYMSKNDNLIITPHIAGLSKESEEKAAIAVIKMLKNELR
jgi:phosphoglycerate dehydrogenase-like enzyme/CMP-N-acetylneuraminic acid synthetase